MTPKHPIKRQTWLVQICATTTFIYAVLTFWHHCVPPHCPPLPPSLWLACLWTAEAGLVPPVGRGAQLMPAVQLHYTPESRSGWAWHPDRQTGEGKRREIKTKQLGQTSLRQKKLMKINVVFCESMQKWLILQAGHINFVWRHLSGC